ncbi:MAG: hypothetical protein J5822_04840 [Eubacteriaceae bacterium]|nr:hypothetical protein [Eubacteriaceae bacterium]
MKKAIGLLLAGLFLSALLGGCASSPGEEKKEEAGDEPQVYPLPVNVMGRYEESEQDMLPRFRYSLAEVHEVDGRQGIAWYDGMYYVSGSTTLSVYDAGWNCVKVNSSPFDGMETTANHIGDIDVWDGEIYAGVEYFMDGAARDLQIAVYDAETLQVKRTFPVSEESGQTEVSGITVDPDSSSVWMCCWEDGESGRYLYRYSLGDGSYLGKYHLQAPPQWIQGIVYYDGWIYITSDDGTADLGEADHIYRCRVDLESTSFSVMLERTLDDVTLQGEIEGISVDRGAGRMLISYNRGSRIVLGMVRGLYEGYEGEIHEVFVYDMYPGN